MNIETAAGNGIQPLQIKSFALITEPVMDLKLVLLVPPPEPADPVLLLAAISSLAS